MIQLEAHWLKAQAPDRVRGRASSLKLTPLGLQTGESDVPPIEPAKAGGRLCPRFYPVARFAGLDIEDSTESRLESRDYSLAPPSAAEPACPDIGFSLVSYGTLQI